MVPRAFQRDEGIAPKCENTSRTARALTSRDRGRTKKIRARPRTPARRILCDQHRRTVAYSVPN
jgi:hypothetical protein